jgi:hypothetical protein
MTTSMSMGSCRRAWYAAAGAYIHSTARTVFRPGTLLPTTPLRSVIIDFVDASSRQSSTD